MEKKPTRPMTPFDELTTPPHLQMLKLFLPYTPAANQEFLGVFIKFQELQQTLSFFRHTQSGLRSQAFENPDFNNPMDMVKDLQPYLPAQQAEMVDTLVNVMNMMEMAQAFQEGGEEQAESGTSDFDSSKENGGDSSFQGFNPMDMMMGMLTPEQQNMFQMYNTMSSQEATSPSPFPDDEETEEGYINNSTVKKGDETNERLDESSSYEEY